MTSKEKETAVEKIIDASETKSSGEQIVGDNTLVIDHDKDNDLNDYLDNSIFKNIRTIDQSEIENSLVKQKFHLMSKTCIQVHFLKLLKTL